MSTWLPGQDRQYESFFFSVDQEADRSQMTIPFVPFMIKEITLKCSLAYNDEEFKDTVDAFIAGTSVDPQQKENTLIC